MDLWDSLKDKFGQRNGVLLSKLKKTISNLKQGEMFLSENYTKLHKMMSQLQIVDSNCTCRCEFKDILMEKIQFVNGLNDTYEAMRNQLLLMDLLPSISGAYSLVLQIEW